MVFTRKRVYASAFRPLARTNRGKFKRRRFSRRKGKKSTSATSQKGSGFILNFKSKKLNGRVWRKKLWDSTTQKAHYRSAGAFSGVATTTVANTTWQVNLVQAVDNGAGPFWTTAGGAQVLDSGVAVPTFRDDIVLRGGRVGMSLYNDSTTGPVEVLVVLVKNSPRPAAGLAAIPTNPPVGWDLSMFNEFTKDVGRVVYNKKMLLEANAVGEIEYRLPVMKIDQEAWSTDQQRYIWFTLVRDFDPVDQNTIRIVSYFNVSFSADAA